MTSKSPIEWTEYTWNPTRGCSVCSEGCEHCYAMILAHRFGGEGMAYEGLTKARKKKLPVWTGEVRTIPEKLDEPRHWRKPHMVFVNSMSDLFHERVPLAFIKQTFDVMAEAEQHTFQVLTKRADRLAEVASELPWTKNIWMGVSVENADNTWRIDRLREVPAAVRFISAEPLLGPLPDLDLDGIHWVIAGGESGPKSRPMEAKWVRDIRRQCRRANALFFFKQWGGRNKAATGRLLDGREYNEMPESLN